MQSAPAAKPAPEAKPQAAQAPEPLSCLHDIQASGIFVEQPLVEPLGRVRVVQLFLMEFGEAKQGVVGEDVYGAPFHRFVATADLSDRSNNPTAQLTIDIDCWSVVYGHPLQPGMILDELLQRLDAMHAQGDN